MYSSPAPRGQLGKHPGRFVQRRLDVPDIRDLASLVEMQQLEAILHTPAFQFFQSLQQLGHRQSEFRTVTAGRLPAPRSPGRQFHTHADFGSHANFFSVFQNQPQLGVLFDHRNNIAADLMGEHRRFDELGILETIADDRRVVRGHRHHGQQLRLAASLQAELIRLAELQHLFDHLPLLVHLDRVNAAVVSLVLLLGHRRLKGAVNFAQAMLQNIGEANQNWQIDAAQLQPIDQLLQIDRPLRILGGVHANVPIAVHRKVAIPPPRHFVQFSGIGHRPAFQIQINFQRRALVAPRRN